MSKERPWAKWPLPDIVNPVGRRCFVIRVPDEPSHIAAFRGAMLNLASAYKWSDDIDHTAKDVALVWREVIDDMGDCQVFDVRANPTNPCVLQKYSSDTGEWIDFANIADCIEQQFPPDNPPTSSQPGENSQGPTPAPGQCYEYNLTLHANGVVLIPIAVQANYGITLTNPKGATRGSAVFTDRWNCYDGQHFVQAECLENILYQETDPLPTAGHMSVIMQVPDGTFVQLLENDTYIVPETMPDGNYVIQCNDTDLSDNAGDITFHLQVCANVWCHLIDLLSDNGDFVGLGGTQTWTSGQGWHGHYLTFADTWIANTTLPTMQAGTKVTITRNVVNQTDPTYTMRLKLGSVLVDEVIQNVNGDGTEVIVATGEFDTVYLDQNAGNNAGECYITSVKFEGSGLNPFGANNC